MSKFCKFGPKIHTLPASWPLFPVEFARRDELFFDILCRSSETFRKVILDVYVASMLKTFDQRMQLLWNVMILAFEPPPFYKMDVAKVLLPVPLGQIFPGITAISIVWHCNEFYFAEDLVEEIVVSDEGHDEEFT